MFIFKSDGTFVYTIRYLNGAFAGVMIFQGDFSVTKGKITTSNVKEIHTTNWYYGPLSGWKSANGQIYNFEYTQLGIKVDVLNNKDSSTWHHYHKR